jgi:hypothetical protein
MHVYALDRALSMSYKGREGGKHAPSLPGRVVDCAAHRPFGLSLCLVLDSGPALDRGMFNPGPSIHPYTRSPVFHMFGGDMYHFDGFLKVFV